jgi:hypothetical protein
MPTPTAPAKVQSEAWAERAELERKAKSITFADYVTAWTRPGPPSTARSHARGMATGEQVVILGPGSRELWATGLVRTAARPVYGSETFHRNSRFRPLSPR